MIRRSALELINDKIPKVDSFQCVNGNLPDSNFVISRNRDGSILSKYEDMTWNFSPYTEKSTKIYFDNWLKSGINKNLLNEGKWILFLYLYLFESKNTGRISIGTIFNVKTLIKSILIYLAEKNVCLQVFLNEKKLLKDYVLKNNATTNISILASLMTHLIYHGQKICRYGVGNSSEIQYLRDLAVRNRNQSRQTPVIPSRIFSNIISHCHNAITDFTEHLDGIERFVQKANTDYLYGTTQKHQRDYGRNKTNYSSDFYEACQECGIFELIKQNKITSRSGLISYIYNIMIICKTHLHCFTGARDEEIKKLKIGCLENTKHKGRDILKINGVTTKLSGGEKKVSWVTSKNVIQTVKVLERISRAFSCFYSPNENIPLFNRIEFCDRKKSKFTLTSKTISDVAFDAIITEEDIRELEKIDPYHDWISDKEFQIGSRWIVKSHQLRRSLAVYAAQSGLVSIQSLRRQLKHITREMSLYYARGSSFSEGLFEKDIEHFAKEYDEQKPEAAAIAYIYDVLLSDEKQHGSHGGYVERNEKPKGEAKILEEREKTIKRFKRGEIAYIETSLGACTSTAPCKKRAMRSIAACVSCEKAVVKASKLDKAAKEQRKLVDSLSPDSMEYRVELEDLKELERMQFKINREAK